MTDLPRARRRRQGLLLRHGPQPRPDLRSVQPGHGGVLPEYDSGVLRRPGRRSPGRVMSLSADFKLSALSDNTVTTVSQHV